MDDLIDLFARETRPLVAVIAEQATAREFRQVESLAHKLKGFARNLGAKTLAASCEEVEVGCRALNAEALQTAMHVLARKTEDAIALLDAKWRSKAKRVS